MAKDKKITNVSRTTIRELLTDFSLKIHGEMIEIFND